MRTDYNVEITECSISNLSSRDRLRMKDLSDALLLNDLVADAPDGLAITPVDYAVLKVHNDKVKEGQSKDYTKYLIIDEDGQKYTTGSESFWNSFMDIWHEMNPKETGEKFEIKVYEKPSKNFSGKGFITCSII